MSLMQTEYALLNSLSLIGRGRHSVFDVAGEGPNSKSRFLLLISTSLGE